MVRLPQPPDGGPEYGVASVAGEAQEPAPSLAALSQEVKELVRLISTTDISELHLESGSVRITIKRGGLPAGGSHLSGVYTPPASLPESHSAGILNLIGNSHAHGEEIRGPLWGALAE